MDASRLLPLLGVFLFFLPLLHQKGGLLTYFIYLFAAWLVLIGIAAVLARFLNFKTDPLDEEQGGGAS